jgi:hypothetical protein
MQIDFKYYLKAQMRMVSYENLIMKPKPLMDDILSSLALIWSQWIQANC